MKYEITLFKGSEEVKIVYHSNLKKTSSVMRFLEKHPLVDASCGTFNVLAFDKFRIHRVEE